MVFLSNRYFVFATSFLCAVENSEDVYILMNYICIYIYISSWRCIYPHELYMHIYIYIYIYIYPHYSWSLCLWICLWTKMYLQPPNQYSFRVIHVHTQNGENFEWSKVHVPSWGQTGCLLISALK
jgi:hypothetical protein